MYIYIYLHTHSILALLISHSRYVALQLGHEVSLPVIFMSGDQPEKTKDVPFSRHECGWPREAKTHYPLARIEIQGLSKTLSHTVCTVAILLMAQTSAILHRQGLQKVCEAWQDSLLCSLPPSSYNLACVSILVVLTEAQVFFVFFISQATQRKSRMYENLQPIDHTHA